LYSLKEKRKKLASMREVAEKRERKKQFSSVIITRHVRTFAPRVEEHVDVFLAQEIIPGVPLSPAVCLNVASPDANLRRH
jgi:hypothetical protein